MDLNSDKSPIVDFSSQTKFHSQSGFTLWQRLRCFDIWKEFKFEVKLSWFTSLIRMPPGHLPVEVFWAHPTKRRPRGRPRDNIFHLSWESLGLPPEELKDVTGENNLWAGVDFCHSSSEYIPVNMYVSVCVIKRRSE